MERMVAITMKITKWIIKNTGIKTPACMKTCDYHSDKFSHMWCVARLGTICTI